MVQVFFIFADFFPLFYQLLREAPQQVELPEWTCLLLLVQLGSAARGVPSAQELAEVTCQSGRPIVSMELSSCHLWY